ncbi:glycosyltransferase family 4 protein [Cyclobacterium jeungdonense]|uniref:Glycosyltransferase family 4 protein n=1 Tax=Cyclobacterium jeungdonense TaxID=708087 RepID=A0ABT8C1L2_9BACT|nr:glycosyltransferase family 4 protein [Cyclobacterium jeungdonense]MDN3686621.1 glycosyltransferase family 4 protein [Cyclobacterium jeungdonense]
MAAIFLYPKIDKMKGSPNPYMLHFQEALLKNHQVVNSTHPNRGILNFFLFFFNADVFILNWPETIPEKKLGGLQTLLFRFFLWLRRKFKKKIIWVLHNKGSHHKGENPTTRKMFNRMMVHSDYIITHSQAGADFVQSEYPSFRKKVHVFPHPVTERLGVYRAGEKEYDFLIWGSIFPYKGIDRFLKFVRRSEELKSSKVLLVGRCKNQDYKQEILSILPDNAVFKDELLSLEEIASYVAKSRFTLFTYNSKTVLSSGSLVDSIRMGAVIIGPDHGAFRDLKKWSFLHTYREFDELPGIIAGYSSDEEKIESDRKDFMEQNTWGNFVRQIEKITGI